MTTMTLNISDMNILENLKQMLSSMTGVEIVNVSEQTNDLNETAYIMSSPTMVEILEKGDQEIAEGKGKIVKIESLWK